MTLQPRAAVGCMLDEVESDVVARMMSATGLTTEADVLRLGLWHLARHLDIPIGVDVFRMDGRASRRQKRVSA